MRISNINNNFKTYKTPSFGYSKKANKQLQAKLDDYSAFHTEWGSILQELQSYCNNLENVIRNCEKKHSKSDKNGRKMNDYIDLFVPSKALLCAYVTDTFPELQFADKEFIHYKNQLVQKKFPERDWRKDVCEKIQDWSFNCYNINNFYPENKTEKQDENILSTQETTNETSQEASLNNPTNNTVDKPTLPQSILDKVNPKSFLEIYATNPNSPKGFSDVAGMFQLKQDLNDKIIQYVKNPEQAQMDYEDYGITRPKAILLYGPPGTGKTYITQALSQELQSPLYMLNIGKAGSHYINLTSKNIKEAFEQVAEMSKKIEKPVILFMDEIDSLAFDRSHRTENEDLKQVSTILQELEKIRSSNVLVIGATNKVNILDPAVYRRFDEHSLVDVPDIESIQDLLKNILSKYKKGEALLKSEDEILEISKQLKGFSNKSICGIAQAAAVNARRRDRADISIEDFQKAIKETSEVKPNRADYLLKAETSKKPLGFAP